MTMHNKIRLGEAENKLVAQLKAAGASCASDELARKGLPTRRVEAYHYTDLKNLLRDVPDLAEADGPVGDPAGGRVAVVSSTFPTADIFAVSIINGQIRECGIPPLGVTISTAKTGSALVERDDVLVAINRGLVRKNLIIGLGRAAKTLVRIDRRIDGNAAHVADGLKIEVAAAAHATVLEVFEGSDEAHMGTHGTHVTLGKGASLTHVVLDLSSKKARHFHTIDYDLNEGAKLANLLVGSGSFLSRTQMFAVFNGEGARGDFTGLNLVDGDRHCDITLDVTHAVANTTSTEMFKSVVRDHARAIFQGRIVVAPKARKTDAKMMAQGLMLSEGAQILTKPELEIFADDVQCGHGATCGELDADSMFYLMSRGISRKEAGAMLIRAFVQELIDPIENIELNAALSNIVDEWLAAEQPGAGQDSGLRDNLVK